ncbi:MAG: sigma-70 family RNA polymerase sigma factor [Myxococcales bacterium]|nr:sigma-70 family RNA polymerase sigma factor [Myxococcales bacterium]
MTYPKIPPTLVDAAREGDRAAAESLARRLQPRVDRRTRRLLRSGPDAEDAAQISMIEILQSLPRFRGDCSIETWADRITTRHTLAFARRRRRESPTGALDTQLATDGPTGRFAKCECRRVLDHLSDVQADVVALHHGADWTMREIADALGIPLETARSRARLAMVKLRAALAAA